MLKEIAAKKIISGYGYICPGGRPSSKPLTAHCDTRVRITHAHSDHPPAVTPDLIQGEVSQAPAQWKR